MILREILNLYPLPHKWLSNTIGSFVFNERLFGILLDEYNLELPKRNLSIVNITFGVVIDSQQPISSNNIDRQLTNFDKPRTVMTTVANACVNNKALLKNDIIVVAASDQVKEKRVGIYGLAVSEISTVLRQYDHSYRAITPKGAILIVSSRVELTQDEIEYVGKEMFNK